MDIERDQWRFKAGDEVRSGDDHKLGKVTGFWPDMTAPTHLVVEGGLLFHHSYYVPVAAVTTYDGSRIYLDASSKAEAERRGWDTPPAGAPPAADLAARP